MEDAIDGLVFALKQYLLFDVYVIKIDVRIPKLQGCACMLNTYGNGELSTQLTAWLCCAAGSPVVDCFLCQHCANYSYVKEKDTDHVPGWGGPINSGHLIKAFLCLLPEQKMVIYLKLVKGFSTLDVAGALSKSVGAVKAIQNRALITLLHLVYSN